MSAIAKAKTDPLDVFMAEACKRRPAWPVPLVSTTFDISIEGGLAIVTTKRVFRNEETASIEATITFPVPVHATLFRLEARVDGRVLRAVALERTNARDVYEDAIEGGKGAVLHEEVLRGVHMLSVAHVPPDGEIEVITTWAAALTIVDGRGFLRIPLTVGDIYGRSSLPDSDALMHGGPLQMAELTVRCSDGSVALRGRRLEHGRAHVALNAPIDLEVIDVTPRDLYGRAADGREVVLRIEPRLGGNKALNVAVLMDNSGSMAELCTGIGGTAKHQAAIAGLKEIAGSLRDSDVVEVWEFNDSLRPIGSTAAKPSGGRTANRPRDTLPWLLRQMSSPAGGTEIGAALARLIAQSRARDVLLITDGKSYALDVHKLAQSGRRICVVLVGEDSLEANVGHLAALTGGEIFVVSGNELQASVAAALGSLRLPYEAPGRITGELERVKLCRGGATLIAEWRQAGWRPAVTPSGDSMLERGVAAVAASLALVALDSEAATALAKAEGLVTHLTSLVVVDQSAEVQHFLPTVRKIALPSPQTFHRGFVAHYCDLPIADGCFQRLLARDSDFDSSPSNLSDLSRLGFAIDWDTAPDQLLAGDFSAINPAVAKLIERGAALPQVVALARQLKITPVGLLIGLLARVHSATNRSAARIARTILRGLPLQELDALSVKLGLEIVDDWKRP